MVEYLNIPAYTKEGISEPPIFVYPGGNTHLGPCFEHLLYLDRRIIVISPLGYGWSSEISPRLLKEYPLNGAEIALRVIKALEIDEVELFFHSNAAPIGGEMMLRAEEFGVKISKITFVNPLGLRYIPWPLIALAFPISGMLSRILSLGYENPYKFLGDLYTPPEKDLSFSRKIQIFWLKMCYELDKSSQPRLTEALRKAKENCFFIPVPIIVVLSRWDWASLFWRKFIKKIFRENVLPSFLEIKEIPGLHNATLGRESKYLAEAMLKSAWNISLALVFLPQLPVYLDWLLNGIRLIHG